MTVSSTTTKVSYTGNGVTSVFAYTFKIFADSEINVWVDGVAKTLVTHYSVSGAGSSSGGNVTFTAGNIPASSESIVFTRTIARTQVTDYVENDTFPAETHEAALDKLTLISQEIDNKLSADIFKFAETVTDAGTVEISLDSATRSSKVLAFDSSGGLVATQEIGVYQGNWAASTAYAVRDLIKDTSNNNVYICITAHTSSGAQPISTNADVAKWTLIVDAASAATSATAAATSATSSASSATAAASSATAAASSATSAASSATSATSSASTATTQASAASTSATAAAARYDNFDDRYLGTKSSDPTLDNDGDALVDGALYFNTTDNVLMVYDLGGTTWNRTTPTSADQTKINTVSGIASNVTTVAGISGNVTTVAGISSNVTTVAGISSNVTTVAGISSAVSGVNTISSAVSAVNSNSTNINAVNSNSANINTVAGISANTTTVAGISSDVTAVAGIASDIADVQNKLAEIETAADDLNEATSEIDTVANAIANVDLVGGSVANVNLVGGSITNVNTVASNITGVNSFADRYRVSGSAPASSLDAGDLYFDTGSDTMKVYGGSGWQNAGSSVNGTSARFTYTISGTPSSVSGSDDNGETLAYDAGYADVYLNGVRLSSADITITSGTTVTFASALTNGDIVDIVGFGTFSVASVAASAITSGTISEARLPSSALGAVWESKSNDFTAEARKNYFCDTSSNDIDVTLPSGTIGDEIHFLDVTGSFDTNDLTILYGTSKIQGASANLDVAVERAGFTLVYYNATQGWLLKDI